MYALGLRQEEDLGSWGSQQHCSQRGDHAFMNCRRRAEVRLGLVISRAVEGKPEISRRLAQEEFAESNGVRLGRSPGWRVP